MTYMIIGDLTLSKGIINGYFHGYGIAIEMYQGYELGEILKWNSSLYLQIMKFNLQSYLEIPHRP